MGDYFEFKNIFLPSTMYESQMPRPPSNSHISSDNVTEETLDRFSDDSSAGFTESGTASNSDSEVFESIETTYQVIGKATRRSYFGEETDWWVVDIKDPEQIAKINRPGLLGISGLFKYPDLQAQLANATVLVEITYNAKGYCQYKKNRIVQLL